MAEAALDLSDYEPRLKAQYRDVAIPKLKEEFGITNAMLVPRLEKVVLNMGIGEAVSDSKKVQSAADDLSMIAGQKAVITKARKELRESIIAIAPIFGEMPYFMNEEFSLVDCCVAPILWRLKEVDITLPEKSTRPLLKYMQTMFEREAFRASLTEAEIEMQE